MKTVIFLVFLFWGNLAFTQNRTEHKDIPDSIDALFNIKYQPAKGFRLLDTLIVWSIVDGGEIIKQPGMFYAPVLQSKDKECVLMYALIPWFMSRDDSLNNVLCTCCSDDSKLGNNLAHRSWIKQEIKYMYSHYSNVDDYVSTLPAAYAKRKFNADSVFLFNVSSVTPLTIDKKYEYCTRMFISRRDRPFLMFVWFFTEQGEKSKQKYMDKLHKKVWYKDGEWDFNARNLYNWTGTGYSKTL
ncbi:MAG: hypothetical protein LBD59_09225 [Prevotellaceae bacterium]|jgi:hypothetical protein|nr:hypothetical protein [Prevotellaceae bacterium]